MMLEKLWAHHPTWSWLPRLWDTRTEACAGCSRACAQQKNLFAYLGSDVDVQLLRIARADETRALFVDELTEGRQHEVEGYVRNHEHDARRAYRQSTASVRPFVDDAKHWTLLHGLLDGRLQEGGHGRVTRVDGRGILRIESNATAVRTLQFLVRSAYDMSMLPCAVHADFCGSLGTLSLIGFNPSMECIGDTLRALACPRSRVRLITTWRWLLHESGVHLLRFNTSKEGQGVLRWARSLQAAHRWYVPADSLAGGNTRLDVFYLDVERFLRRATGSWPTSES